MANTKVYRRVNLKVSSQIHDILVRQSGVNGMNLSAYISHLIIAEEERIRANERMEKLFSQMFPNGVADLAVLAKLMKEVDKGAE
jgi:uncharacterized protein (DUF1778 family)